MTATDTATVTTESTCACGQALDCCHTAHCPRCGVTLHPTLTAA
jgi:hypothetical protein